VSVRTSTATSSRQKPGPRLSADSLADNLGPGFRRDDGVKSVKVTGTLDGAETTWLLPEEVPAAILINSQSYAVMMATPADLEDFAIGFALSEGLVKSADHVRNVLVMPSGDGFSCDLAIDEHHIVRERMVSRSLEGRVGCGLCGIEDMADAIRMPRGTVSAPALDPAAVVRAFDALPQHQPMNAANRTVHAAAWCLRDGTIVLAREDVGRHNALDKLIGAMARGRVSRGGFVLMSSRCSFELVQKCALAGIGALATVSAPTALAFRLAREAGLQLAAMSKQGVMIFDGGNNGNA
jgi:FdhD protein